jgi:hypothetical protein
MRKMLKLLLVSGAAGVVLVASACAGAAGTAGTQTPDLSASALNGTPQAVVDTLDVNVTPADGGFNVTVSATADTPKVNDLFLSLSYDPANLHVGTLTATDADGSLGLAVEPTPGTIELGVVSTDGQPVTADGATLCTVHLAAGTAPRNASQAADAVETRAKNLALRQNDAGDWELSWDYTNPGDTTQDGMVSVGDLTPLGAHFLEELSGEWDDPLRHVDCDGNGQVGISDLTPMGAFYGNSVYAYKIQMSEDGVNDWLTVGELILADQQPSPNETVRFTYTFGAQYVPQAWYRVRPQTFDLQFGTPSEAISEGSRMVEGGEVPEGDAKFVVVSVMDLPQPIRHMNGCRVVYPDNYSYVTESYNLGSIGGARSAVDGLWASFAVKTLFPPDGLLIEQDLGNGYKAMDFNVTVTESLLDASPAGHGDLFNFQLRRDGGSAPLSLQFVDEADTIRRTYFSGPDGSEHFFGNSLVLTIK